MCREVSGGRKKCQRPQCSMHIDEAQCDCNEQIARTNCWKKLAAVATFGGLPYSILC